MKVGSTAGVSFPCEAAEGLMDSTSCSSHCWDKIADKGNLREKGFISAYSGWSMVAGAGGSWCVRQLEQEAAGV